MCSNKQNEKNWFLRGRFGVSGLPKGSCSAHAAEQKQNSGQVAGNAGVEDPYLMK